MTWIFIANALLAVLFVASSLRANRWRKRALHAEWQRDVHRCVRCGADCGVLVENTNEALRTLYDGPRLVKPEEDEA